MTKIIPPNDIVPLIRCLRDRRVILDADLARLYGAETRALVQAIKRNASRFPEDFLFQLTQDEAAALRSQIVILKPGRGHHRKNAQTTGGAGVVVKVENGAAKGTVPARRFLP